MVSASHYLASVAAFQIFGKGGNAVDAGVAGGLALNVVERHFCDLGGVAPIVIFMKGMSEPVTIDGLGRAPAAATLENHLQRYGHDIPAGIGQSVVPAAVDGWLTALANYGRLSLADVAAPALELAAGFPAHPWLSQVLAAHRVRLESWPSSTPTFLPGGRPPRPGEPFRQPDLRSLLERLLQAELAATGRGRAAAIMAARDEFYRGSIAREIAAFAARENGFLTYDDLAEYRVSVAPGVHTSYRGYDVYSCGPWCQGPVVPMTLNILEGFDVTSLELNGPDHLHLLAEALKLAFADREAYFGDPDMVEVPIDGLLSKEYAAEQRGRIDLRKATPALPPAGDPWRYLGESRPRPSAPRVTAAAWQPDTSYICTVDDEGNAFSATPSDPGIWGPLVPGLGIAISTRGAQFWLDPAHPSVIAPRKRPRLTPNPALVLRNGRVFMPFGCPGGDAQPQGMVQVLSNIIDRGMDVQAAIESPRVVSYSFPNSFWPHTYEPGQLCIEGRISTAVQEELSRRGHRVQPWPNWYSGASGVSAITVDEHGTFAGGADPRLDSYAVGW